MFETMKNLKEYGVVMLPTEDETLLWKYKFGEYLEYSHNISKDSQLIGQNLYILSDLKPKEGDYFYDTVTNTIHKATYGSDISVRVDEAHFVARNCKKIIATTNKELTKCSCGLDNGSHKMGCENKITYPCKIPQSLIKAYAEQPFDEVELEYIINPNFDIDTDIDYSTILKLTDDNEVVWSKDEDKSEDLRLMGEMLRDRDSQIEKMYTREEVEELIIEFAKDCGDDRELFCYDGEIDGVRQYNDAKEWIKDKLK